ncbi:hypothetical protein WJX82_000891 [Trebouxia sp. C0006]
MQCDLLTSAAWWRDSGVKLPARVQSVQAAPGVIKQRNCSVLPYVLGNSYRDQEYRDRSRQSYEIETRFLNKYADKLQQVQAKVPDLLYEQWHPDGNGLVIVMEDLRAGAGLQAASTRLTCQALGLNSAQAVLALKWLSRMHAACWGCSPQGIWPQGSYWSLDKRQSDLAGMPMQWAKSCSAFETAFPETFAKASVQALAERLLAVAAAVHQELSLDSANSSAAQWRTIIHGDFKTANLFFSPTAEAASLSAHQHEDKAAVVSACDFQWCGGGLGVTDVMYLLWTSVQPQVVVDQEEELLRCYYSSLMHQLQEQHHIDGSIYSFQQFGHHYQMAYLDYIRFLIGAMWGTVTPSTCNALSEDINQGMHKRLDDQLLIMCCGFGK